MSDSRKECFLTTAAFRVLRLATSDQGYRKLDQHHRASNPRSDKYAKDHRKKSYDTHWR